MTYSWYQNGAVVAAATSSMLQIDTVDSQNGTPKRSAARAAWTSARRANMPARPTGARSTGMVRSRPSTVVDTVMSDTSRSTRWRRPMSARSDSLARSVDSS